jgi:hypothetical protein
MRISCDIDEDYVSTDIGDGEGVRATCRRCGAYTESLGTSENSVARCLVMLREECPMEENNFYVEGRQLTEDQWAALSKLWARRPLNV